MDFTSDAAVAKFGFALGWQAMLGRLRHLRRCRAAEKNRRAAARNQFRKEHVPLALGCQAILFWL